MVPKIEPVRNNFDFVSRRKAKILEMTAKLETRYFFEFFSGSQNIGIQGFVKFGRMKVTSLAVFNFFGKIIHFYFISGLEAAIVKMVAKSRRSILRIFSDAESTIKWRN